MLCFSGIGGMIKVGCRLTSICRKDENSEYRRRTSKSYHHSALSYYLLGLSSYRGADSVDNESSTAFMILACVCDYYWHLWVLVEDLLDPAIVDLLPRVLLTRGAIFCLILGVAKVFGVSEVIGRFITGATTRRRGGILCIKFYLALDAGIQGRSV